MADSLFNSISSVNDDVNMNSNDSTANNNNGGTAVAVLVSRGGGATSSSKNSNNNATVGITVAALIPRKRIDSDDKISSTIQHWSFIDDKRQFTHLDSLLTRLAPIRIVHVACTESAEVKKSNTSSSNVAVAAATKRAQQVTDLLTKLSLMIQSRTDVVYVDSNSSDAGTSSLTPEDNINFTNIYSHMPNEINDTSRMNSLIVHLLGGESSAGYLRYRGDIRITEEINVKRVVSLLLHCEGLYTQLNNDTSFGTYEILSGILNSHLSLDRTASECINLLPPPNQGVASYVGGSTSNNSLFGVLNKCLTKMGSRTLETWLRQPLIDLEKIQQRQNAVSLLVDNCIGRDRLRDEGLCGLKGIDIDNLANKIAPTSGTSSGGNDEDGSGTSTYVGSTQSALESLYKLYTLADLQIPNLVAALSDLLPQQVEEDNGNTTNSNNNNNCALRGVLDGLNRAMNELHQSKQLVEAVLDLDAAPRNYMIQTKFNDNLDDIKNELEACDTEFDEIHNDMNKAWSDTTGQSFGQVRLEPTSTGNTDCTTWQFRIPDTNAIKILQSDLFEDNITVHRILKSGVYFTTEDLRQLACKKQDLMEEYDKYQRTIVIQAMETAATYVPVLERVSTLVAEIDVLTSLAYVAAMSSTPYCKPTMTDSDDDGHGIVLKEARHPCVELQDGIDFIANDISLIYGESSFLLVTGPNMGGKSTYIRSLGAIVTMAQIGSFVPCTDATINIVHHILARVGAGDVQDRGISTFMAEMLEASSILRTATKRSLIVIDELGRGTSTFDGYGLATAISEYIVQRIGCMTVFATHFHELTALEEREACVTNCHVTAQRSTDGSNTLTFLYEVRPGPCLESFGIQVAEMANVPKVVIADAKRKARQLENFDYRKKSKLMEIENNDGNNNNEHNTAEKSAADLKFVHQFRKLPLNTMKSNEEKFTAIKTFLREYKSQ